MSAYLRTFLLLLLLLLFFLMELGRRGRSYCPRMSLCFFKPIFSDVRQNFHGYQNNAASVFILQICRQISHFFPRMSPYAILWLEMHYLDQPMYSFTGKKLKVVYKMQGIETLFGFGGIL